MAAITPLSALPANGVTPAGTLTLSNAQGRLTAFLSSGNGDATLRLITMTEGGNWAYVDNGTLVVSSLQNLGDNVGVLDFTNASTTTKYHVVKNGGSATVSCWLSALTGPGTSTALVAHASSHLSGGADDLLGAPGNVGDVTPGVFCGTFGPDAANQNTVPSVNGGTFCLIASAQTLTNKTLTAPVINGATSASGNFNLSGSTGTFATPTGAATIGGGAAAITATSSAAAITLTAGAASTWSTSAGALTVSGAGGINLQYAGTTLLNIGVTSANDVTLAANKNLVASAGTGAISLGSMTGDTALPTGNLSWAAAATKTLSLAASGAAAVTSGAALTLTGAAASTWSTSAGALSVSGASGINLQRIGLTLADVGATSATAVTLAANISLAGAAGSGGLSLGSMTGATALPTGALSWAGAANQNLSLVGSGTGTVAINNASTMSIGTSGTTTLTLGRSGQSTVLAGNVSFSAATRAAAAAFTIADPGNAGAIPVTTNGVCALTSAGAETRTLAIPTFMGQRLSIVCDTYVGNIVVTSSQALNQAGNTIMTFGAVRDYIALEAITVGGALRWQVLGVDGVALS